MWETSAIRATLPLVFGSDPCHVSVVVERSSVCLHDDRHDLDLDAFGRLAARTPASQSSGAWNCERLGGVFGLPVRAAHVRDRPRVGRRFVKG